jgi:hypothetical protein
LAEFIRLNQSAFATSKFGIVKPSIACHSGHKQNQICWNLTPLSNDFVGLKSFYFMPKMKFNVALFHLV